MPVSEQNSTKSPWFPEGQIEPLVLASQSPRRSDLLRQVGIRFIQAIQPTDEQRRAELTVDEAIRDIAYRKASAVASDFSDAVILGADTEVIVGDELLGKPECDEDAVAMLQRLSGKSHRVVTGIAFIDQVTGKVVLDSESTTVHMRVATVEELRAYVESGEPRDKAGAYGIQGIGAGLVTRIDGCYFNVVGLPITKVILWLQRIAMNRNANR